MGKNNSAAHAFSMIPCTYSNITTSKGPFWNNQTYSISTVSYLAIHIAALALLPRVLHFILRPLGQPLFVSYVVGGILVGPSGLGLIDGFPELFMRKDGMEILDTLATFGSMMFLFKVGVKTDPTMVIKAGKKSIVIGFFCMAGSFFCGTIAAFVTRKKLSHDDIRENSLTKILTVTTMTSFPVIACTLTDLNIINTDLGRLAISSSMVGDFIHFVSQSLKESYRLYNFGKVRDAKLSFLSLILFIIFASVIVRSAALWMIHKTPEGKPVRQSYISCMLGLALVFGFISDAMGQTPIFGAFVLGLAIPDGPPLGAAIVDRLECLVTGIFMPLHLAIIGLKSDVHKIELDFLRRSQIIITSAFVGKMFGVLLPALRSNVPFKDAVLLGLVLNSKGIIEIAYLNVWADSKMISPEGSTVMVCTILAITMFMTPLITYLYDPSTRYLNYKRRSILYGKHKSGIRILTCVQNREDVPPIIKLLQTSILNSEKPLHIYLLHLVELVGRASPLLIAHSPKKKTSTNPTKTEQIINAFRNFEECNRGLVFLEPFSTVSPYISMHNDVCTIALDKKSSLIIFPFHKQDDDLQGDHIRPTSKQSIKTLIKNLLHHAPCSIGFLIDHNHSSAMPAAISISGSSRHHVRLGSYDEINYLRGVSSSISRGEQCIYRVGVLFLGGADDREALAYALLMTENPMVEVNVIRFIDSVGNVVNVTEKMLDNEVVDHFRFNIVNKGNSRYKEERIVDSLATIDIIKSMKDDFELVMVGRRQPMDLSLTAGLEEWNECEELGIFGDLLASPDFRNHGSVLVVQQGQSKSK